MVPIGRTYTSTVSGQAIKTATCERCSEQYVYVVERSATGSGTSVLFLNNDGASDTAEASAAQAVEKALAKAVDPAACPGCRWYQRDMVKEARWRRGKVLFFFALIVGGIGAFVAFLAVVTTDREPYFRASAMPKWYAAAGMVGAAAVALAVRFAICHKWDPNTDEAWKQRRQPKEAPKVMRKADFDRLAAESKKAPGAGSFGGPA